MKETVESGEGHVLPIPSPTGHYHHHGKTTAENGTTIGDQSIFSANTTLLFIGNHPECSQEAKRTLAPFFQAETPQEVYFRTTPAPPSVGEGQICQVKGLPCFMVACRSAKNTASKTLGPELHREVRREPVC